MQGSQAARSASTQSIRASAIRAGGLRRRSAVDERPIRARPARAHRSRGRSPHRGPGQVSGRRSRTSDARSRVDAQPDPYAAARSRPAAEKSTAVTAHPCAASQSASEPWPHPASRARPGFRPPRTIRRQRSPADDSASTHGLSRGRPISESIADVRIALTPAAAQRVRNLIRTLAQGLGPEPSQKSRSSVGSDNEAAQESNLPSAGLRRPAGFEDRMEHQLRATPARS